MTEKRKGNNIVPSETPRIQLTMLNNMAGSDWEQALARHVALGLKWLDLKDSLFGQTINDLSRENAQRIAEQAHSHGLKIHCLSSSIGYSFLSDGEAAFRTRHLSTLDHVLRIAEVLQPQAIRLLGAKLAALPPPPNESAMEVVARQYPWVFSVYGEMIARIRAAGFMVGIENEVDGCILASAPDILAFFERADPDRKAYFIYDVQNLWQMGVFPSVETYRRLKPLIGGFHLKGGQSNGGGHTLHRASALEDASWPVREIVRAAIDDRVAPVICLNPSHGQRPPDGYSVWETAQRDVAFLRRNFSEVE